MKKIFLILIITISAITLSGCGANITDSEKFYKEYETVPKENLFVYRNIDEVINILEHGTGVVYLGFPECPWCRAYVPYLNEVSEDLELDKIYYFNILEERKNNTKEYQKIVTILSDYLNYDSEGNKRIYVPSVIVVNNGEIKGFDDETSLDTHNLDKPSDYWTTEEITDLKTKLNTIIPYGIDDKCTKCNS